jgi:hypothetical protein
MTTRICHPQVTPSVRHLSPSTKTSCTPAHALSLLEGVNTLEQHALFKSPLETLSLTHFLPFSLRNSHLRPSKCTAHRSPVLVFAPANAQPSEPLYCLRKPMGFGPEQNYELSVHLRTGACRSEVHASRSKAEATCAYGPRRLVRVHPRAPTPPRSREPTHALECHEARVCARLSSSPA